MNASELIPYLDTFLNNRGFVDRSNNGLQVQGPQQIERVAFAVDASMASFKAAIAQRAQLLIVHHGLFWSEHLQITGAHFERVRALIEGRLGLYACHIPLDAHPTVGNNAELARIAGLIDTQPWGLHKKDLIGVIGALPDPTPLAALNARLERVIGPGLRVQGDPAALARTVAICSGMGVTLLDDALAAGADTLITGETSHQWFHPVAEAPINVIFGGHYNTETVGLKALERHLRAEFGLTTGFIDLPTGL
jgi:dinuclear metal center YbgI/SA1388 family protein